MNNSESITKIEKSLNLYERIIQVYLEVTSVTKDAEVGINANNSYLAVSHDAVTKALHLPIAKAGIVIRPTQRSCIISILEKQDKYKPELKNISYRADVVAEIEFINASNPEERMTSEASAYSFDSGDKSVSKAYSMAIKMILLKTFMLESLDEEEARPTELNTTYKQQPLKQEKKELTYTTSEIVEKTNEQKIKAFAESLKIDDMKLKSLVIMKYGKPIDLNDLKTEECKSFCEYIKKEVLK